MYSKICILIVLVISSLFLSACNDEPTSAGLSVLNREDLITVNPDSTFLTETGNYSSTLNFYNSDQIDQILLGKYNGIQSDMLAQFTVYRPDTILAGLLNNSVTVSNAWIEMKPLYKIGNDISNFSFSVFRVNSGWPSGKYVSSDSLSNLSYNAQNEISSLKITDTLYTVNLNTASVLSWAKDTSKSVIPLYFRPSQSLNALAGFKSYLSSASGNPLLLKVVYEKTGTGAYKDTVTYGISNNLHVMKGPQPAAQPDRIVMQGGVGARAWVKFDLSKVPANSIINRAVLELRLDPAASKLGSSSTSYLYASFIKSNDNGKIIYDSTVAYPINRDTTGQKFAGDISPIVQKWNLGQPNNGVSLSLFNERTTVDLLSFMGKNNALRPKLTIVYTAKK